VSFFGQPLRVGIPIGLSAGFGRQGVPPAPPPAPGAFTFTSATQVVVDVVLNWTASANASFYAVTRGGVNIGNPTGLTWTDSAPPAGATTYAVVATNVTGIQTPTPVTRSVTVLAQPGSFSFAVPVVTGSNVALSWSTSSAATNYQVKRDGVVIASPGVGILDYADNSLANGTYTYEVIAQNIAGDRTSTPATRVVVVNAAAFPAETFFAPLTNSLALTTGTGPATFTRASTATVVDDQGIVRNCVSGESRFQGARRGGTNYCLQSQVITGGPWSIAFGSITQTPNAGIAPDGTNTATRLTSTVGVSDMSQSIATLVSQGEQVFSLYVKAVTPGVGDSFRLRVRDVVSGNFTATGAWQRFEDAKAAASGTNSYGITRNSTDQIFDLLVWGAQLDLGASVATSYAPTNVNAGPLFNGAGVDGVQYFNTAADGVTPIPASTLLGYLSEGQRTNLQAFAVGTSWPTSNAVLANAPAEVSPMGTTGEVKLITCSNPFGVIFNNVTSQSGIVSITFYAKAQSGTTSVRSGSQGSVTDTRGPDTVINSTTWTRVSYVGVPTDLCIGQLIGSGSVTSTPFFVWGAQLEAAPFASSYIPTTSAVVTRIADSLTFPVSNIVNAQGGSVATVSMGPTVNAVVQPIITATTGGYPAQLTTGNAASVSDGTNTPVGGALTYGVPGKMSTSWGGSTKACANGGAVTTGAFAGSLLTATAMIIGNTPAREQLCLRDIKLWNVALSDAQLITVTTP